jgi:hypothetical protein
MNDLVVDRNTKRVGVSFIFKGGFVSLEGGDSPFSADEILRMLV